MPGIQDAIAAIMSAAGQDDAPVPVPSPNAPEEKLPPEMASIKDSTEVQPEDKRNKPSANNDEKTTEKNKETTSADNIKNNREGSPKNGIGESDEVDNAHLLQALRALIAMFMTDRDGDIADEPPSTRLPISNEGMSLPVPGGQDERVEQWQTK